MDIARPDVKRKKQRRRIILTAAGVIVLACLTMALSHLQPALPSVDKGGLIIDTVKRGEMLRQVRGNGTLVPKELLFVQSATEGRVERIFVLPGAPVHPDTVLFEMSNPDLEQQVFDLQWQLKGAEASLQKLKIQLESERLTQEASLEKLKTDLVQAQLEAEADATLAQSGLVPELIRRRSSATAEQLVKQLAAEKKRLAISPESASAQLAVQQAEIEKFRASLDLAKRKLAALKVKAGAEGVLQRIGDTQPLQAGQRVSPGSTLAVIVQPRNLKAEIKVAETQAKDIELAQRAEIDTRNGTIPGEVVRIDPAAVQGTVTVDVKLAGELPKGARPDLSVDGTIELERMTNVLYVARPLSAQSEGQGEVFKLTSDGSEARRVRVKFGRNSVSTIAIKDGLAEGDQIITSDMSQWETFDRIKLR